MSERLEPVTGRHWLGCKETGGFRNDGSYRYCDLIQDPFSDDEIVQQAMPQLADGRYHASGIDVKACVDVRRFLKACSGKNIHVVVTLPPVHPDVLTQLRAQNVAAEFWHQLPTVLNVLSTEVANCEFHDYSDARSAGVATSQYVDFLHASDVAYARMLIQIVRRHPDSALSKFVSTEQLQQQIAARTTDLDLFDD